MTDTEMIDLVERSGYDVEPLLFGDGSRAWFVKDPVSGGGCGGPTLRDAIASAERNLGGFK